MFKGIPCRATTDRQSHTYTNIQILNFLMDNLSSSDIFESKRAVSKKLHIHQLDLKTLSLSERGLAFIAKNLYENGAVVSIADVLF